MTLKKRGAETPAETNESSEPITVRYMDAVGQSQTIEIRREPSGAGPRSVDVPGGTLVLSWGETYPEKLLGARFEPSVVKAPEEKRELQDVPLPVLKTAYADYRVKVRAAQDARAEAERIAHEIACRIGKAQVTIGGETFYAKRTSVRKDGGAAPRYPLTLSEVTKRAEHEEE